MYVTWPLSSSQLFSNTDPLIVAAPFSMSRDSTSSEIWNNILNGNVEKDDPLWKEYLDKAAVFDERMVDELNKIVDVLLVFVGYFLLPSR